jgi:hypothetical protein
MMIKVQATIQEETIVMTTQEITMAAMTMSMMEEMILVMMETTIMEDMTMEATIMGPMNMITITEKIIGIASRQESASGLVTGSSWP